MTSECLLAWESFVVSISLPWASNDSHIIPNHPVCQRPRPWVHLLIVRPLLQWKCSLVVKEKAKHSSLKCHPKNICRALPKNEKKLDAGHVRAWQNAFRRPIIATFLPTLKRSIIKIMYLPWKTLPHLGLISSTSGQLPLTYSLSLCHNSIPKT